MAWRLWVDAVPRAGWMNMAIDTALQNRARREGEGWLRLYAWEPSCLSFGRHEPATRRYDVDRIRALGLDAVRRPTGGRAVWHAGEATYAVAAPVAWLGSLRQAYLTIHEMLRSALAALGAEAALAPPVRPAGVDAGACFAQPAGGEVLIGGRKVIGSAQCRDDGALLQHGSILLENDQSMVGTVSRGAPPPDLATPLNRWLATPASWNDVCTAVGASAARTWPGDWKIVVDPANLLEDAQVHADRFRSPAWTWSR